MTPFWLICLTSFVMGACAVNAFFDAQEGHWYDWALNTAVVVVCVGALWR